VQRVLTPELIDDPEVADTDLRESLAFIRAVNRRLGGIDALLSRLRRWSARWPRGETIRLIDIGTGSADIPLACVRWAREAGHDVQVTAVDVHPKTLAAARDHIAEDPEAAQRIELVEADARRLMELYEPGQFHYAHAGMFLHHLPEIEVLTVLRIMHRLASAGIVWNDLLRSPMVYTVTHLMTARMPEMVRHDARVSIRADFNRRDAADIARRVGLDYCRVKVHRLKGRIVVAGEKPGAWS
jgi:2-polyprenyl-3-methyl-5-hydroxy-6-metoxy-1,4-benzoquinol methylase